MEPTTTLVDQLAVLHRGRPCDKKSPEVPIERYNLYADVFDVIKELPPLSLFFFLAVCFELLVLRVGDVDLLRLLL